MGQLMWLVRLLGIIGLIIAGWVIVLLVLVAILKIAGWI